MISINELIVDRIGRNEIAHTSVSLNIALVVGLLTSPTIGVGISFLCGLVKEISDSFEENNIFSWRDMMFNAFGLIISLIVLLII